MDTNNRPNGKFYVGFFLGGLIGAVLIFILGTEKGKKAAEDLLLKLEGLEEDAESNAEKLQTAAEKQISRISEKTEKLLSEAENLKEKAVEKVMEKEKEIVAKIKPEAEKLVKKIESVKNPAPSPEPNKTQTAKKRFFKKSKKPA